MKLLENKRKKKFKITSKIVKSFLGIPKYLEDDKPKRSEVGLVMGLAWTAAGGVTMPVEVTIMPGKG